MHLRALKWQQQLQLQLQQQQQAQQQLLHQLYKQVQWNLDLRKPD